MPVLLGEKTRYRVAAFKPGAGVSIALAAAMLSLGIFAVVAPSAAALRPALLFGWLAVLSGVTHVTYTLAAENAATFLFGALIGAAYVLAGLYLAVNRNWPAGSTWWVGMIVGVNLIVSGFSRLMHSTFARTPLRVVT